MISDKIKIISLVTIIFYILFFIIIFVISLTFESDKEKGAQYSAIGAAILTPFYVLINYKDMVINN
jgi:hypothetical membrane protein